MPAPFENAGLQSAGPVGNLALGYLLQQLATIGFSSLGGRVTGELRVLSPVGLIEQTWHIHDLASSGDGSIQLLLSPTCTGCELKLIHTGIADGKSREVLTWWENNYFRPLTQYFEEWVGEYAADMGDG